jgi:MSHA type pilus biogenesis protein MshL
VNLDQPVTLSLRNTLAEDALKIIFSNLDCFYTIDNNILKVEAMGTKVFELGHPALVNTYSMSVGGDILSAAGAGGLKGTITSGSSSDGKAFDFWGSLETSLMSVMGKQEAPAAAPAAAALGQNPQTKKTTVTSAANDDPTKSTSVSVESGSSTVSQFARGRQQQNVTINRLTGTIMVTANRQSMDKVERYLDNVRKVLGRQVMIEARILEVQLNDAFQFGIDWTLLEQNAVKSASLVTGFGALSAYTSALQAASSAASGASKFQLGVSKANFQAMLTALQTQGEVRILSNPKINVMNGHASILTVGNNTSFISRVTTTTTTTSAGPVVTFTPETSTVLSGMIIGVIPYISESGEITLNITPITSEMTTTEKTVGPTGNQVTITVPNVALREMTTTVKLRDGNMAVIGGLISKKESKTDKKVPGLGSIPYLGRLFTNTDNTETRTELVLLLRPRIVEND